MPVRRLRSGREVPLFLASASSAEAFETIVSAEGDVRLYRGWLTAPRADALLAHIRETTQWTRERRTMYDRMVDVPREQAWLGDDRERAFTAPLDAVRRELEQLLATAFYYVLLNRYRHGNDSVAWHNDREVDGIAAPVIASLTLGVTRRFDIRPKTDRRAIVSIDVDHGDLIVMAGDTQRNYEHRVRKDPRIAGERINLTFRQQAG